MKVQTKLLKKSGQLIDVLRRTSNISHNKDKRPPFCKGPEQGIILRVNGRVKRFIKVHVALQGEPRQQGQDIA
jgi:hypothetical protein